MAEVECFRCGVEVEDELSCKLCFSPAHYICAFGAPVTLPRNRAHFNKGSYTCAVCVVSKDNTLTLRAVSKNQLHNAAKSARDPVIPDPPESESSAERDTNLDLTAETQVTITPESQPIEATDSTVITPGLPSPIHSPTERLNNTAAAASNIAGLGSSEDDSDGSGEVNLGIESGAPPTLGTPPGGLTAVATNGDAGSEYVPVMKNSEVRRVKRCKGLLHGLKHLPSSVATLIILDSNGRAIKGDVIDSSGGSISVGSVGGLCIGATITALSVHKETYPNIKTLVFGLGTNDRLHAKQHPGDIEVHIIALNAAAKKVFPQAAINFILPFSAIKGLSVEYTNRLSRAIHNSGVRWRVLKPHNMKGNLVAPAFIHIKPECRSIFTNWLRKMFSPSTTVSPQAAHVSPPDTVAAHTNPASAPVRVPPAPPDTGNSLGAPGLTAYPGPTAYPGLAREIAAALSQMLQPYRSPPLQFARPPGLWPAQY